MLCNHSFLIRAEFDVFKSCSKSPLVKSKGFLFFVSSLYEPHFRAVSHIFKTVIRATNSSLKLLVNSYSALIPTCYLMRIGSILIQHGGLLSALTLRAGTLSALQKELFPSLLSESSRGVLRIQVLKASRYLFQ